MCLLLVAVFFVASLSFIWVATEEYRSRLRHEREAVADLIGLVAAIHRRRVLTSDELRLLGRSLEQSQR